MWTLLLLVSITKTWRGGAVSTGFSWVCRSQMQCSTLSVEVEKNCQVTTESLSEPGLLRKEFLAVHPDARALERDLKCDRQPVIIWLCSPSFHMLKGFLSSFSFNLIKICHHTSLTICLTGNKDICAINASGSLGAAVQGGNISLWSKWVIQGDYCTQCHSTSLLTPDGINIAIYISIRSAADRFDVINSIISNYEFVSMLQYLYC